MREKLAIGSLFKSKKTNRCLFLIRNGKSFKGQFGLVGGKVRKNEDLLNCLSREIEEEIGFIPEIKKFVNISEFVSEDYKFKFFSVLIVVDEEFVPVLNEESSGYAWVDLRHLPKPMHPRLMELFKNDLVLRSIEKFK